MPIREILLSITILMISLQGFSQSPFFKHYTVEDGLPSAEVYSAFQDSKGYMWFATDAGVSRFNGYEFENFDASDGLTDNTIFLITEDHKGRIWFGTFNCQLSYFENDRIYPYQHNDKLADVIKEKRAMNSFEVDSNDNIWIGFYNQGLFKCNRQGDVVQMVKNENECSGGGLKIFFVNNRVVFGLSAKPKKIQNLMSERIAFEGITCTEISKNSQVIKTNLHHNYTKKSSRTDLYITKHLGDILITKKSLSKRINFNNQPKEINLEIPVEITEKNMNSTYSDNYFLWFSTTKGVYKCRIKNNKIAIVAHYFKDKSVSRVYRDHQKGLWIQTIGNGVYYSSSDNFSKIPINNNDEEKVSSLAFDSIGKKMYALLADGSVTQINYENNNYANQIIFKSAYLNYPLYYNHLNNELLLGKPWKGITSFKKNEISIQKTRPYNTGFKSIIINEDTIYKVNNNGFSVIIDGVEKYLSFLEYKQMWCTSLIRNNEKFWIGTNDGIRIYQDKKITNPFKNNKFLSTAITSIERLNKETFLIGTKSYGVLVIKKDTIAEFINKKGGLPSNLVRKIHVDGQNEIWVITNKGLSRIKFSDTGNYVIHNLNKKQGLGTQTINDITSYQNTFFLATADGLIEFDKTKIKINPTPPYIYITQVIVNSEERELKEKMELSYQENFITIHFEGINYQSLGEVEYQYRMIGVDTNWITTTTRSVQYTTLQANDYVFEIKAKNEDGIWSNPANISFTIHPPFWFTWWFIMGEIMIGLLIIYLLFMSRLNRQTKKNEAAQMVIETEKKMVELELKALRAQMNPHFIFNTLNTIQNAINTLDKKVASNYIASFGRLIRIVLETSKKTRIRLNVEIQMLSLYMELEAVRFSNKFSFVITKDKILSEENYYIPSMVIQPFVENAIIHGLIPKKEDKLQLNIDFKLINKNTIICVIEDNGIGRAAAMKVKKLNKKSMGMQITKERLNLYYKETGKPFSFRVIDLLDQENLPLGTRVEIIFPI